MKMTPAERQARRDSFRKMSVPAKLEYIWMYYRLRICLGVCALAILISAVHRGLTEQTPILYVGMYNVSAGEGLMEELDGNYMAQSQWDTRKECLLFYQGQYLAKDPTPENHEYAYASSMKLLATIQAKKLDVALMNQESYDILSANGYLLELDDLDLEGVTLCENQVTISDNSTDVNLGLETELEIVTESAVNAVDITDSPLFQNVGGMTGTMYFGMIGNTPRLDACLDYLSYLTGE